MARPTIYTTELAKKICKKLGEGATLKSICKPKTMPNRSTIYDWLFDENKKHHTEFSTMYARAKNEQADSMFEEILTEARSATNTNANAIRVKVDALKWATSKLRPQRYGDKATIQHEGNPQKPIEHKVIFEDYREDD